MAGRRNQHFSFRQLYECLKTARREEIWLNAKLLTEAEEQCVHTHGVHAEEAMGDEVGSHYHRLGEENHIHQELCCGIKNPQASVKHQIIQIHMSLTSIGTQ